MFDFHEKRKIRSWLYSKTVIGLLLIPVVFLAVSVIERFKIERETAAKAEEREAELDKVQVRANELEKKVYEAESERGIETEIRSRYDVAKAGEQVVVIVDEETAQEDDLDDVSVPEKKSFWQRILPW